MDSAENSQFAENKIKRLAGELIDYDFVVAIAGNPNTGKSTVFNKLTGLRQHVGNWAGKTVAKAEGFFDYEDKTYKIIDLPGTYSLLSTSIDEEIARDFLLFAKPDVTVIVVDATRIERNLHLVLQILEITNRAVVALNLIDEARRNNIEINIESLEKDLQVPVIPMAARRGEGIKELQQAIKKVSEKSFSESIGRIREFGADVENAVQILSNQLNKSYENLTNARWIALRLLEGDESIIEALQKNQLGKPTKQNAIILPKFSEAK